MRFTIAGEEVELDAAGVRRQMVGRSLEAICTYSVQIDGVRWPPEQVLALATGISRPAFISHTAIRDLRRLGFQPARCPRAPQGVALLGVSSSSM